MALQISPRKILLTKPIADAAKKLNPSITFSGMKADPSSSGFPLGRLEENAKLGISNIPSITVKAVNFKGETYYSVIDGRHRSAIAIANNLDSIPANLQGGKRRTKKTRRNSRRK